MYAKITGRPLLAGVIACLAMSLSLVAQTTSSPYEPELNAVLIESAVDVANLKTPAALPALLVTLVQSGVAQLRARVDNYDPVARTVRITLYLTTPSAAMPTPAAAVPPATDPSMVSQSVLRVESIYHVKGTPLSIAMVGRFVNFLGVC